MSRLEWFLAIGLGIWGSYLFLSRWSFWREYTRRRQQRISRPEFSEEITESIQRDLDGCEYKVIADGQIFMDEQDKKRIQSVLENKRPPVNDGLDELLTKRGLRGWQ